ncbi:MAG: hypothetical protein F6K23_36670 [Okeania sp. SIO2C9]|uniref:hypothetical protein n=1 Tax=Okeania sp. SIO2C9 TaxID=2607791 RepID=UPI0013C1A84F|nr:hypothetical protein [Okeania sp. SIO2C9]NEQ78056.1 hypothetical protein [Okeania sp. SIO2C9]
MFFLWKISLNIALFILAFSLGGETTKLKNDFSSELFSSNQKKYDLEPIFLSTDSQKINYFQFAYAKNKESILEVQKLTNPVHSFVKFKAHNVEVSEDVACTFHITPNHNPKVGKPSLAWFALTRKGGKSLPFSECDCQLNVYSQPRNAESKPIMNPELKGIDTEQYQDIPGAEITFPQAGVYDLEIIGSAKDGKSFQPFKFNYSVTVTGG